MSLVDIFKAGWWKIKTSSPFLNDFLSMFLYCFNFAQTLQCSIVPLVQFPRFDDGNMKSIEFFSCIVESLDGPGEV